MYLQINKVIGENEKKNFVIRSIKEINNTLVHFSSPFLSLTLSYAHTHHTHSTHTLINMRKGWLEMSSTNRVYLHIRNQQISKPQKDMQTTSHRLWRPEYDHRVLFGILSQWKQTVNFPFKKVTNFECPVHMLICSDCTYGLITNFTWILHF